MRQDVHRELFADPDLPYREALKFYQHDVDWANRLMRPELAALLRSGPNDRPLGLLDQPAQA